MTVFKFKRVCYLTGVSHINGLVVIVTYNIIGEPRSLTESMQLMDELLSDTGMDRLDKMEKLEALLTHAVSANSCDIVQSCNCNCHSYSVTDISTQTLSTGDVVITNIYVNEEEKGKEKILSSSTKKIV